MESASIAEKFDLAIALEELAGAIYTQIADQTATEDTNRVIFTRLAAEEAEHANRIRMLRGRYLNDQASVDGLNVDTDTLRTLVREAKGVLANLQGGRQLSLGEARQIMIRAERRFAAVHAHTIVASTDPAVRDFFQLLARQDKQHAALMAQLH